MEMKTQRTDFWTQWGRETVGLSERVALTYIHISICKIERRGNLLFYTRNPKPVLCNNLKEWDGEGVGREV